MDHELLMRNTRKITELENRQRVNISNVSNEAKVLKNEGTTVKAVRGAVVCNSVIKAPNIPEDLAEQLANGIRRNEFEEAMDGKADKDHTHTEFGDLTITGKINSCRLNTNSYTSLGTVPVIPVIKNDGVMEVGRIIDFHNLGDESTDKTVRMRLYGTELRMVEGATLTAANIAIDNETRLKAVEETMATKADNGHTHADLETAIASKADNGHTHTMSEITDYEPPEVITRSMLLDLVYPIGSVYVSTDSTSPATRFGGTWEQIKDRFLYCTNSSLETGGSKKITYQQLPPHSHGFICPDDTIGDPDGAADTHGYRYNYWRGNRNWDFNMFTEPAGDGQDYMPPYMTVYAWYRTA